MVMTDPIADMLTRIRNGLTNRVKKVRMPKSKIKLGIAKVLQDEGYIHGFSEQEKGVQGEITVDLKYGADDEDVISRIQRISRPGRRVYRGLEELTPVLNGLGIAVLSTSKGILSDRAARKANVGGEVLCEIW